MFTKRFNWIALVAAALVLCACSKGGSDASNSISGAGNGIQTVTDLGSCVGSPSPHATVFTSGWYMQSAAPGFSVQTEIIVQANSVTMTNTCADGKGAPVSSSVTEPAKVTGNTITILKMGQSGNEGPVGSGADPCGVLLNAGVITYSFVGPCLVLNQDGQMTELLP